MDPAGAGSGRGQHGVGEGELTDAEMFFSDPGANTWEMV